MNVLLVSWIAPSQAVTGYVIFYQQDEGERMSVSVEASATSYNITELNIGTTYSIFIIATSNTLPSTVTGPHTITLGIHSYCTACYTATSIGPAKCLSCQKLHNYMCSVLQTYVFRLVLHHSTFQHFPLA